MPIFHHFNQRTLTGPQGAQGSGGPQGPTGNPGAQATGTGTSILVSTGSYATNEVYSGTSWVTSSSGPSTTTTTGTGAVVFFSAIVSPAVNTSTIHAEISFCINGDMTDATLSSRSFLETGNGTGTSHAITGMSFVTGLTPGSNTFTFAYKSPSNVNWNFNNKSITVIPY